MTDPQASSIEMLVSEGESRQALRSPVAATLQNGVFYHRWDVNAPKGVVLLVHGLGEHSGRYQHVAEALNASGIAVIAPDHLGHGQSPGPRCHIDSFGEFFTPLDELRDIIDRDFPNLPCFLLGHSLGGLIVGTYLALSPERQSRFAGAAFSGAAFEVEQPPAPVAIFINKVLASLLPRLGVLQLDPSEVSRDPQVVRRYREDPLVHDGKVSARLVVELFASMQALADAAASITIPVLIMHGESDVMTAPVGSQHFFDRVASEDKTLRLYPGLFHEIFNEPEQERVLGELCNWLNAHVDLK